VVTLMDLWLPIVVSAAFVFIASAILHAALPFWHNADYRKAPDDRAFVQGMTGLRSGLYLFPNVDWKTATPEQKAGYQSGPSGVLYLRNPANFSFGKALLFQFLYCLVGSALVAYVVSMTAAPGAEYMRVHRIAGTAGMLFWCFGTNVSDAFWYGKPWSSVLKNVVDGIIFGFLIGGTFGWLWPL
jgi:hypothetical protein